MEQRSFSAWDGKANKGATEFGLVIVFQSSIASIYHLKCHLVWAIESIRRFYTAMPGLVALPLFKGSFWSCSCCMNVEFHSSNTLWVGVWTPKGVFATHKVFGRLGNKPDRKHVFRLLVLVAVVLVSPHCLRPRDVVPALWPVRFPGCKPQNRQFLYLDLFLQSPRRFAWNSQVRF